MINFYDFEVFKYDWLVVIMNPAERSKTVIVNNPEQLEQYYNDHKNEIFAGYNVRHYDQYIFKGILCGFDPKKINDYIIVKKKQGWQFSSMFKKIKLIQYDVMTKRDRGLKQLEGFMGNNIKETSVPFDIDRKLTEDEINESIKYCEHDVEQTMMVFAEEKEEFESHMGLIKTFGLPLDDLGKSKPQLAAKILDAHMKPHNDEFDFKIPDCLKIERYKFILDWYKNPDNFNYEKSLEVDVAGVPHMFAWGGLHGARKNYAGKGIFLNVDVQSYYPSMMIHFGYTSRNLAQPKKYEEIYHRRLEYKKNKDPRQAPLKIVLNSSYGAMKDNINPMFDPCMANSVCVSGMLLLLDLIEKLMDHCEIIQSNTDGVLLKLRSMDDYDLIDDICWEWEERTGMRLEFDLFEKVFQKDVNNYIIVDADGHYKSKGAYVKKLNNLDNDLPIINKALIDFYLHNIPVERTINDCNDLKYFQKIVKVSSKYMCAMHGSKRLNEQTLRVFASKSQHDKGVFKVKQEGANPEKFALTPEHCFIENGDVNHMKVPEKLDRQWYIDLANQRLKDFGV